MNKTYKLLSIIIALNMSACSVPVKTSSSVPEHKTFTKNIRPNMSRDEVLIQLGAPQSTGVHIIDNKNNKLDYYFGLSGDVGLGGANLKSGTAFMTYENDKLVQVIYYSTDGVQKISGDKEIPINKIIDEIIIGESSIDKAYEILGQPDFRGIRFQFHKGINHKILFYDASEIPDDGSIKEKWLLIGYDDFSIIQDIIWVSSEQKDIKSFGEISPQQLMQISRMDQADFGIVYAKPESFSTNTKMDAVQIEALLRTAPSNISDITDVLGKPTAYGIKSLKGDIPVILAHYSHMSLEITGREEKYIAANADEETRNEHATNKKYYVMDAKQTFLMIGHDIKGNIQEIIWIKP